MIFVKRLSRGRKLACWYMALQLLTTMAIAERECFSQGLTQLAQLPEPLPPPVTPPQAEQMAPEGCPPAPKDTPLAALNVDIHPRDLEGNIVASDRLPTDCAGYLFTDVRAGAFDPSCSSCQMSVCDLLQLAQYCHNPLYFEERLLERYGMCSCCCQPLASAACFYGNALCLPVKMWRHCPCSCIPAHPCD